MSHPNRPPSRKYGYRMIVSTELWETQRAHVVQWIVSKMVRDAEKDGLTIDAETVQVKAEPIAMPQQFEPWWRRALIRLRIVRRRTVTTEQLAVDAKGFAW